MAGFTVRLFGKEAAIYLKDVDKVTGEHVCDEAYRLGLSLHKVFDFYDGSSELSALNRKRQLKVSEPLLEVLKKSLEFSRLTRGQYDITLGKDILQRKKGNMMTETGCSFRDVKIEGDIVTLVHDDALIDLGSVAKGYITDRMTEYIMGQGVSAGLIDARGDIRIFGDAGQTVGIQHPRDESKAIGYICLKDAAVATSGDYSQYIATYDNCHIVNRKELVSVTAVATTLMMADLIATAFFVADRDGRASILDANKDARVLMIDRDLNMMHCNRFEESEAK